LLVDWHPLWTRRQSSKAKALHARMLRWRRHASANMRRRGGNVEEKGVRSPKTTV
jgi:hypothetical protein